MTAVALYCIWLFQMLDFVIFFFFFFNDTATTEIYTLSLHDALPISVLSVSVLLLSCCRCACAGGTALELVGQAGIDTPAGLGHFTGCAQRLARDQLGEAAREGDAQPASRAGQGM